MEAPLAPPNPIEPTPTDEALMIRVQTGDKQAYRTLYERYQGPVYGFLLRRTQDKQAAAELFQETFLRVYRARNTYTPQRPFRPWLYGIAVNAARDKARQSQRRPQLVSIEGDGTAAPNRSTRPTAEQHIALEQAIASLPDILREAFLLGVVEGFDHKETAAQLGIQPGAARTRISRARAMLRDILGDGQ